MGPFWFMHFHSYAALRISNVLGARVPRVTRRSHARVRVSYECLSLSSLVAVAPLLNYFNGLQSPVLLRQLSAQSTDYIVVFLDVDSVRTRTCTHRCIWRYQIDRHRLRSRIAPIDNKIKGRSRKVERVRSQMTFAWEIIKIYICICIKDEIFR